MEIEDDPAYRAWRKDAAERLYPLIEDTNCVVTLLPRDGREGDIKFAVELGLSIMLDKPIIVVANPGTPVPGKLAQIADVIVEGDMAAPDFQERMQAAVRQVLG